MGGRGLHPIPGRDHPLRPWRPSDCDGRCFRGYGGFDRYYGAPFRESYYSGADTAPDNVIVDPPAPPPPVASPTIVESDAPAPPPPPPPRESEVPQPPYAPSTTDATATIPSSAALPDTSPSPPPPSPAAPYATTAGLEAVLQELKDREDTTTHGSPRGEERPATPTGPPCPCTVECRGDSFASTPSDATTWAIGNASCTGMGWPPPNATAKEEESVGQQGSCTPAWLAANNDGGQCEGRLARPTLFTGGCVVKCGTAMAVGGEEADAEKEEGSSPCTCRTVVEPSNPVDPNATSWACLCASPAVRSAACFGAGCDYAYFVDDLATACAAAVAAPSNASYPWSASDAVSAAFPDGAEVVCQP